MNALVIEKINGLYVLFLIVIKIEYNNEYII